jgi:hypothetical protein
MRFVWIGFESELAKLLDGVVDVVNFPADVMEGLTVFRKMLLQRVVVGQWLNQLQPDVAHVQVSEPNVDSLQFLAEQNRQTHFVAIEFQRSFCVVDDNGDMVNFSEHEFSQPRRLWSLHRRFACALHDTQVGCQSYSSLNSGSGGITEFSVRKRSWHELPIGSKLPALISQIPAVLAVLAIRQPTMPSAQYVSFHTRIRCAMLLCCAVFGLMNSGCVHRRMTIQSSPPGALVLLDGKEIGYAPVSTDFTYYGTREVTLIKDGYETLTINQCVPTPWYQIFPLDFFSDNLLGSKKRDRRYYAYQLEPKRRGAQPNLIERANGLRSESLMGF